MGDELVDGSSPQDEPRGASTVAYAPIFDRLCPYYLAIGMSPAEYWDGDCTFARHYRDSEEMQVERLNSELWLQARYIYEALCDVAPIINSNSKKGTRARPFAEEQQNQLIGQATTVIERSNTVIEANTRAIERSIGTHERVISELKEHDARSQKIYTAILRVADKVEK